MNATQRKTIAYTGLTIGGLGLIGFLAWLFNALDTILRAINLDALPEGWVVLFSLLGMVVGGFAGLLNLHSNEPPPVLLMDHDLRDELANLCHEQWSGWMRYQFDKGTFNTDGSWLMPSEFVKRWQRQVNTPFEALSQPEQDSDRKEADKFLAVIHAGVDTLSIQRG